MVKKKTEAQKQKDRRNLQLKNMYDRMSKEEAKLKRTIEQQKEALRKAKENLQMFKKGGVVRKKTSRKKKK